MSISQDGVEKSLMSELGLDAEDLSLDLSSLICLCCCFRACGVCVRGPELELMRTRRCCVSGLISTCYSAHAMIVVISAFLSAMISHRGSLLKSALNTGLEG